MNISGAKLIKVSINGIGEMLRKIGDYQLMLDEKYNSIVQCLEKIHEAWRGSEASIYVEKMQQNYCGYIKDLADVLTKFVDVLNDAMTKYQEIDSTYSNELNGE